MKKLLILSAFLVCTLADVYGQSDSSANKLFETNKILEYCHESMSPQQTISRAGGEKCEQCPERSRATMRMGLLHYAAVTSVLPATQSPCRLEGNGNCLLDDAMNSESCGRACEGNMG